ncbi:MAG: HAD family hydrolase [Ruminococcus sp.]|nr:HAD family hydrolase [Ruminococcus sp.]
MTDFTYRGGTAGFADSSRLMRFGGYIFDLDGTLIDSNGVWEKIDRKVLEKNHVRVSQREIEAAAAMTYEECLEFFHSKGVNCTLEELKNEFDSLAEKEYRYNIFLKEGVREFLTLLKNSGKKLAVATASPKRLYEPVLRHNCVYGMFDTIVTTDEAGASKDSPEVYLLAAEKMGVDPAYCVVFEDVLKGIVSARNAGMYTVAVYDKYSSSDVVTMRNTADEFIMGFGGIG